MRQPSPSNPLATPKNNPEEWTFTDGSHKDGNPRQGASIIHSPTNTTTYIDASGEEETHTIMRAELGAIHVALDKYKHDPWLGIFTDSQTSLHAIQNELQRPSHTKYHHHKESQTNGLQQHPRQAPTRPMATHAYRLSNQPPHHTTRIPKSITHHISTSQTSQKRKRRLLPP